MIRGVTRTVFQPDVECVMSGLVNREMKLPTGVPLVTPGREIGIVRFAPAPVDRCNAETLAPVSAKSIVPLSVVTPPGI